MHVNLKLGPKEMNRNSEMVKRICKQQYAVYSLYLDLLTTTHPAYAQVNIYK